MVTYFKALTVAGSDSGGGAGIQADLKTFAALKVFGTSAITSVTAQNTQNILAIKYLPSSLIIQQINAVLSDIGANAIKTGLLGKPRVIRAVVKCLAAHPEIPLIIDPVMTSTTGKTLVDAETIEVLRNLLLPLAHVVTPNFPEAKALTGRRIETEADCQHAAEEIFQMGPKVVILKGGHVPKILRSANEKVTDLYFDGNNFQKISGPYIPGETKHGTGCTFSAAITAGIAQGLSVLHATQLARKYLTKTWINSFRVGRGRASPLNHFYESWEA